MKVNLDPYPIVNTQNLHLRNLLKKDEVTIFSIRSNKKINTYLNREPANTIADAATFIENIKRITDSGDGVYWGISLSAYDEIIGTICLFNFDKVKDTAEIGYELLPQFQGKGLMQEAITAVISYAFDTMKVKAITACPTAKNISSINLLKRNNFVVDTASVHPGDGEYLTYTLTIGK